MDEYKAVSLFSGCGGFCEGVELAGFDVAAAVELDRFACETYRHNFPHVPLYEGDVTAFLNQDHDDWTAPEADRFDHVSEGTVDLVFGGPPCQGYSQIGTRDLNDPRNTLYREFLRVVEDLAPPVFIMENVPNMLLLNKGMFKDRALAAFAEAGYSNCAVRVLSADDYGVPQARRRALFFGVRDDLDLGFDAGDWIEAVAAQEKTDVATVWQAIGDLPEEVGHPGDELRYPTYGRGGGDIRAEMRLDREGTYYNASGKREMAGGRKLHNHHTKEIQERRKELISHLLPGLKGDSLPKELWDGMRPEKWRRLHPDKPAYTILAQMHRDLSEWVHPRFERWITVREAARLQSFHDGFVFKSSEWQMLKQIGNAVPPLLGRVMAFVAMRAVEQINAQDTDEVEAVLASLHGRQLTIA